MALILASGGKEELNPVLTSQYYGPAAPQDETKSGFVVGKKYCIVFSNAGGYPASAITFVSGASDVLGPFNAQNTDVNGGSAHMSMFIFTATSTSVTINKQTYTCSLLVQLD